MIATVIEAIAGPGSVVTGSAISDLLAMPPYTCGADLLVRPSTTGQLSQILRFCDARHQTVVVHGGRTGFAGGCSSNAGDLIISLERMNQLRVDPLGRTATAGAGVVIEQLQDAAREVGLLFAVDWGGRGSATVGGAISTNAGGNQVLRYGMIREQVLGLEAVLADGTIVSSMSRVIKNNAGYDLKQLFIGSEGTLGIVTAAVLRLRPLPSARATALVALSRFEALARLLAHLEGGLDGRLTSFEVMWRSYYEPAAAILPTRPFAAAPDYVVLLEACGSDAGELDDRLVALLGEFMATGDIDDALIAKSESERSGWWAIRDNFRSLAPLAPLSVFDISLPTSEVPEYLAEVERALVRDVGEARMAVFGHLGDQNIHLVIGHPPDDAHRAENAVYTPLAGRAGSMSAEHGVGLAKRDWLHISRSAEEIDLMRRLKACLDPSGILNPGRIFQPSGS